MTNHLESPALALYNYLMRRRPGGDPDFDIYDQIQDPDRDISSSLTQLDHSSSYLVIKVRAEDGPLALMLLIGPENAMIELRVWFDGQMTTLLDPDEGLGYVDSSGR